MIHHGDCLEVMAGMDPESVDAIVTDPPYGLEFMGKEWDKPWRRGDDVNADAGFGEYALADGYERLPKPTFTGSANPKCERCGGTQRGRRDGTAKRSVCLCPDGGRFPNVRAKEMRAFQAWSQQWAEAAYRVAKPSAYLLAFGGTRTVHRMTIALEDAGWIIRDMLVWGYASGFPKSKASLKPAWEPIVMARKPGPLRMLAVDECRIPAPAGLTNGGRSVGRQFAEGAGGFTDRERAEEHPSGRWPANIVLTDPIFDGGVEGVVGGGETTSGSRSGQYDGSASWSGEYGPVSRDLDGDSGTYSRFFLIPKADRADREPVLGGLPERLGKIGNHGNLSAGDDLSMKLGSNRARANVHPTVKPTDLMRHLVRLVTPTGGTVLDPFLGSGTTAIAAEMEGFAWIGIEREAEYVAIAEARLNGTQRGLGLETA